MARDYAAEYQRRQALARERGFSGYWERRQARQLGYQRAERIDFTRKRAPLSPDELARAKRESVDEFERIALRAHRRMSDVEFRQLLADGDAAMRRKDFAEADRIARKLGYRKSKTGPAGRIFYYHE